MSECCYIQKKTNLGGIITEGIALMALAPSSDGVRGQKLTLFFLISALARVVLLPQQPIDSVCL